MNLIFKDIAERIFSLKSFSSKLTNEVNTIALIILTLEYSHILF